MFCIKSTLKEPCFFYLFLAKCTHTFKSALVTRSRKRDKYINYFSTLNLRAVKLNKCLYEGKTSAGSAPQTKSTTSLI